MIDFPAVLQNRTRDSVPDFAEQPEIVAVRFVSVALSGSRPCAYDAVALSQLYRDRGDCENNFDEFKNQWGWSGFTTHKLKSCRTMARLIAVVANWWNVFCRAFGRRDTLVRRPAVRFSQVADAGTDFWGGTSAPIALWRQIGQAKIGFWTEAGREDVVTRRKPRLPRAQLTNLG